MDVTLMVRDRPGNVLKQTETFKYPGLVMNAKVGCKHAKNRLKTASLSKVERLNGCIV